MEGPFFYFFFLINPIDGFQSKYNFIPFEKYQLKKIFFPCIIWREKRTGEIFLKK